MRWVVLGNPENRRVAFFVRAVTEAGLPAPRVVAWLDWLTGSAALALAPDERLRIESPGESFPVERELLAQGAREPDPEGRLDENADGARRTWDAGRLDAAAARALEPDRGRILHPRQWYLGFRAALGRLPRTNVQSTPGAIATVFDKPATQESLARAGVPIPRRFPAPRSGAALLEELRAAGRARVFVKLACGSSASGVVALALGRGGRVDARTTVELVRDGGAIRLYNSLRVRRYQDARDVLPILDFLTAEGVAVEDWIPKASLDGRVLDVRVLTVGGRASGHVVVRTSATPLTNLHLGNRRGDPVALRQRLGPKGWDALLDVAGAAHRAFPGLGYAGVDVLVAASWKRLFVLEVNAFGDLLANVLADGRDTYSAEVAHEIAAARGNPRARVAGER